MQLMTIKELCAMLGVSHTWIYQQIHEAGFPHPIKLGKNVSRWARQDVEAWVESKRAPITTA